MVNIDVDTGQTPGLVQFASVVVQLTVGTANPTFGRTAFPDAHATGHAAQGDALFSPAAVVHQTRI